MQEQHYIENAAINLEPQNKLTVYYTIDQLYSQNILPFFLTISILNFSPPPPSTRYYLHFLENTPCIHSQLLELRKYLSL
jgi:hypothetical protein